MDHLFESLATHPILGGGILLGALGWLVAIVRNVPGHLLSYAKSRWVSSVEIPDRDVAFTWLEKWLASHPEAHHKRAHVLRTLGTPIIDTGCPAELASPSLAHDGTRSRFRLILSPAPGSGLIRFRKARLWLQRRRKWYETAFNGAPHSDTFVITYLGSARVITDLILEAQAESESDLDMGVPVLVGGNGHWGHSGFKPRRAPESIMLEGDTLARLMEDMRLFYRSRDWYRSRGVPWQRGYLFSGIPGSGKTSAALALAGELGLNIAVVSLSSSEMNDQSLIQLMRVLPERSLLLLEDVDALFVERESQCAVTFAGLLNSLDGVAAAEGRMLVMTTNHPEKLDPALVRFGRIDRRVDFGFATASQARRLFLWFFREAELTTRELGALAADFGAAIGGVQISMAAIQEHLLQHRDSPAQAAFHAPFVSIAA